MTLITILTLTNFAFADEKSEIDPIVKYQKETIIDFEGLEIEGELVKPQGNLIIERKRANFNPLIKLKTDFNVEMTNSANDIQ